MRGSGAAELLLVVALALLGLGVALPSLAYVRDEGRAAAAARQIASTFASLRYRSVTRGTAAGLLFERRGAGWAWWEVEDGNGNGLRSAELERGVDRIRSGPHRIEDRVQGVRLGFPPLASIPEIPPGRDALADLEDPVQFGRSDLVSFSPQGSASSGTLYLSDGRGVLYGVVLYGSTCRVRVWRFDPETRRWTL